MNTRDFEPPVITQVKTENDFNRLQLLFVEFASSIDFDLSYQSFIQELISIRSLYSPPNGIAFILNHNNSTVGCVGLREIKPGVFSVLRLYIRSDFKRPYFRKQLLKVAIDWARMKGVSKLLLDPSDNLLSPRNGYASGSDKYFEMNFTPSNKFTRQMVS
jgi:putative acetyltransferase